MESKFKINISIIAIISVYLLILRALLPPIIEYIIEINTPIQTVAFHTTPSEELFGKTIAINLEMVYGQFAAIKTVSEGTEYSEGMKTTVRETTNKLYYVIKASDGKTMALVVDPELENDVNLLCKNTLAHANGNNYTNSEPLQLRGKVHEMNITFNQFDYKIISKEPSTAPLKLFKDYISKNRTFQQELKEAEVFPYALVINARNDSKSLIKQNFANIFLSIFAGSFGAVLVIPIVLIIIGKLRRLKKNKACLTPYKE